MKENVWKQKVKRVPMLNLVSFIVLLLEFLYSFACVCMHVCVCVSLLNKHKKTLHLCISVFSQFWELESAFTPEFYSPTIFTHDKTMPDINSTYSCQNLLWERVIFFIENVFNYKCPINIMVLPWWNNLKW